MRSSKLYLLPQVTKVITVVILSTVIYANPQLKSVQSLTVIILHIANFKQETFILYTFNYHYNLLQQ